MPISVGSSWEVLQACHPYTAKALGKPRGRYAVRNSPVLVLLRIELLGASNGRGPNIRTTNTDAMAQNLKASAIEDIAAAKAPEARTSLEALRSYASNITCGSAGK
jgi:hypothetical protein